MGIKNWGLGTRFKGNSNPNVSLDNLLGLQNQNEYTRMYFDFGHGGTEDHEVQFDDFYKVGKSSVALGAIPGGQLWAINTKTLPILPGFFL